MPTPQAPPWVASTATYSGPTLENVRDFLGDCGTPAATPSEPGLQCWTVPLADAEGRQETLHVFEERVEASGRPHCDACRVCTWAHHPVCALTFHFILLADGARTASGAQSKPVRSSPVLTRSAGALECPACGAPAPPPPAPCPACENSSPTPHILDIQRHRLHGVLHGHGFGHLARICGREAGSAALSGGTMLRLWDQLCCLLRVRAVSVEDVSTKGHGAVALRLLSTAATGAGWYTQAGYLFGRGAFGCNRAMHARAALTVHRYPMLTLKAEFGGVSSRGGSAVLAAQAAAEVMGAIARIEAAHVVAEAARRARGRKRQIHTLGDLFTAALARVAAARAGEASGAPQRPAPRPPSSKSRACKWPAPRLGAACDVCEEALRRADGAWLSRTGLRTLCADAVPEAALLDHVLRALPDWGPPRGIIRRMNTSSKTTEFRAAAPGESPPSPPPPLPARAAAPRGGCSPEQAWGDVVTLYTHILSAYLPAAAGTCGPAGVALAAAALVVYDTKLFIKEFKEGAEPIAAATPDEAPDAQPCDAPAADSPPPQGLRLMVVPALDRGANGRPRALGGWAGGKPNVRRDPPPLLVLLDAGATVGDLKAAVQAQLQALYPALRDYCVETVDGLQLSGDRAAVQPRPGVPIEAWGRAPPDLATHPLRFQGGLDAWVVRCACGCTDDDGQRMAQCEVCSIWKHTRCEGVSDDAAAPAAFTCGACGGNG